MFGEYLVTWWLSDLKVTKPNPKAQPVVGLIPPNTLMAEGMCARNFDFYTLSLDELKEFTVPLVWIVKRTGVIHGVSRLLALWFKRRTDVGYVYLSSHHGSISVSTHLVTSILSLMTPITTKSTNNGRTGRRLTMPCFLGRVSKMA